MTQPIYETFVHMSQPFGMNVPEIDFHGNNGNVIVGDVPASDRYTEVRLSPITEKYILNGVDKDTVDMISNYLEDEMWPRYLPSVFPRLLVNGTQGIGVSLSTFVPSHNLSDTVKLIANYLKTEELDEDNYYPDFPTGGTIINKKDLPQINKTGKGKVILQAKYRIQRNKITFYEMPYQIYIEDTINEIKKAIEDGKLNYIEDVYNNSDKNGIELVVVCTSAAKAKAVLEQLFKTTHLRNQYNANQNAIVSKTPVLLNLKQIVDAYIEFNLECVRREAQFDLEKIEKRLHIIDALLEAIDNISLVISTIRNEENPKALLQGHFDWNKEQVDAILDMRLSKLSHLESDKLEQEKKDKEEQAQKCRVIVNNESYRRQILCNKLYKMDEEFGSKRKTEVIDLEMKSDSKKKEVSYSTIEPSGWGNRIFYIKRYAESGGKGTYKVSDNDKIVIFTDKGRFFRLAPSDIKMCGKDDRGQVCSLIVPLGEGEHVIGLRPSNSHEKYVVFLTDMGQILKVDMEAFFGNTRNLKGMASMKMKNEGDYVQDIVFVNGGETLSIMTTKGWEMPEGYTKSRIEKIAVDSLTPHGKGTGGKKVFYMASNERIDEMAIE